MVDEAGRNSIPSLLDEVKRCIYRGFRPNLHDLRVILARRTLIRSALRDEHLDAAVCERLMLVVTGVDGCRYCSSVHARQALQVGIPLEQTDPLGAAMFDDSPTNEVPALLYAQHWAEADGNPDPDIRRRIRHRYGQERLASIDAVLFMIRVGNLLGNTIDQFFHHLSLGRWRTPRGGAG